MNFDLTTVPQEEQEIARFFILGRTLSSGPTKNPHIGVKDNAHIDNIIVLKMHANIQKVKRKRVQLFEKKESERECKYLWMSPSPRLPGRPRPSGLGMCLRRFTYSTSSTIA